MSTDFEKVKSAFSKFKDRSYRPGQTEALNFIRQSTKKFIVIEAPTGAGKTLIGMSACEMLPGGGTYTVHSKPLQKQIMDDFPESNLLFGKDNYTCNLDERRTCGQCIDSRSKPCARKEICRYKVHKLNVLQSRLRVFNYSYLLSEANFVGKFSGNQLIVIDEADSLENTLYEFVGITLSARQLKDYRIDLPTYKTVSGANGLANWKEWAGVTSKAIGKIAQGLAQEIKDFGDDFQEWHLKVLKDYERVIGIIKKLSIFIENVDNTWLMDEQVNQYGQHVTFKPLWLTEQLTEQFLWRHSERFILMSATFPPLPVVAKILGIPRDAIDYIELPSTFPTANRPSIVVPVASLSHKTMDLELPKVVEAVKVILDRHPEEKGLIHTVSYKLNRAIMDIGDPRLITHEAKNKQVQLNTFKRSTDPLVFVSPSSERGISLDDDLCRFIVICKAPFLSLGDKGVKQRVYSGGIGQLWFTSDMLLTVVQALGRGVRHETDHCVGYMLDQNISDAIERRPSILPEWFKDALEFEEAEDFLVITKKAQGEIAQTPQAQVEVDDDDDW